MLDLSSLNDQQKKAVTAPLGPVLVLAGAGSGKTRVLAYRIAYLIEQKLIGAGNILALTFTNKAAKEMTARVQKLLNSGMPNFQFPISNGMPTPLSGVNGTLSVPTMGTFHSVGARVLRKEIQVLGYNRSFIIFDTDDVLKVLKETCQELGVSQRFPAALFRSLISSAKNLLQTPSNFNVGLEEPLASEARKVYARYQNYMFEQNALDFDDLLMLPIKVFEARPDILKRYQELFQYILVDEYQDTNPAQYRFLEMLVSLPSQLRTREKANLFVVGDDAQSIYGFRGSDIRNILRFEKDFPTALVVALEQNYRSTKHILLAASKVIALNSEQKKKELWTQNEAGTKVRVEEVNDEVAEAEFVANTIIRLSDGRQKDGYIRTEDVVYEELEEAKPFSILDQFLKKAKRTTQSFVSIKLSADHKPLLEFAVLYRTHAQSRSLEEVFIAAGIPYQIVGGVKFYERKEIKDFLAYVRLVLNFRDLVSLKRVINVPARGIGQKGFEILKDFIKGDITLIREQAQQEQGMEKGHVPFSEFVVRLRLIPMPLRQRTATLDFFNVLEAATQFEPHATLVELMRFIIKKIQMEKWLRDGTDAGESRWENVEELVSVASQYDHMPWREGAESFLEEVALFTDIDTVEDQKDAVTLMTLHSAKGLEFDTVFFVGLEEGVLPHSRSLLDPKELSEEIRLAYVGLTRARKRLYLTYARTRTVFGNTQTGVPSRILQALPEEAIEFHGSSSYRKPMDGELAYEPFE